MTTHSAHPPLSLDLVSGTPRRDPGTLEMWQAVALALLLHLLGGLALWLEPVGGEGVEASARSRERLAQLEAARKPKPMKFRFVDIPDEPQVANPRARDASDRSRKARGAQRPRRAPAPDNPDPYALGNTPQAVHTAPSPSAPGGGAPPAGAAAAPEPSAGAASAPKTPPSEQGQPVPSTGEAVAGASTPSQGVSGSEGGSGLGGVGPGGKGPGGTGSLMASVPRVSESDLLESFHNPGGVSPMDIGTVSFDTAAIDWGPYARRMLQVIRRNWIDRLPPSALSGLRGVAVVNFRIARDGSVSNVTLVDSYGVRANARGGAEVTEGIRPFETTAMGAIEGSDLPPLPDIFEEPDVGVTIAFYYNLRPPR